MFKERLESTPGTIAEYVELVAALACINAHRNGQMDASRVPPTGRQPVSAAFARATVPDLFDGMNKTEKARAIELEAMRRAGQIVAWYYEKVTLKLADDTRYTPDFFVLEPDGSCRFEETKGFWREDAKVKLKVAAAHFPFRFIAYEGKPGQWTVTDYSRAA